MTETRNGYHLQTAVPLSPHSDEAELAVLGSIFIDNDAFLDVADMLDVRDFYNEFHGQVYAAMRALHSEGMSIDFVTLRELLDGRGHKPARDSIDAFLASLYTAVPTSFGINDYARIVKSASTRRRMLNVASAIGSAALDESANVDGLLENAERMIFDVTSAAAKTTLQPLTSSMTALYDVTAERRAAGGSPVGIPSGLIDYDRILRGFSEGMHLIGARPGMGKSALEGKISLNAAKMGRRVARFNLEMSALQQARRLATLEAGIDYKKLKEGSLTDAEWARFGNAIGALSTLPIYIDDGDVTAASIVSKVRRMHAEHGVDMVTVDYVQLMAVDSAATNRHQEVSAISRALKQLSRKLNIPVIVLAQLNRSVESRGDKRPLLSDLKESGDLEQDADTVTFIYRDDYYHDDSPTPNVAELIVAKNREGETGTARVYWNAPLMRFANLDYPEIKL